MIAQAGHNRLEILAADICHAHHESRTAAEHAAQRAIEAGHALLEAKARAPLGAGAEWWAQTVGSGERRARRYMQLARSGIETATVAEMGIRAAVEHLAAERLAHEQVAA